MTKTAYYQLITPENRWFDLGLKELWARQALLWALVRRDLRVRYKSTLLGVIWVVLQPVLSTLIFALVLARVFNSQDDPNYLLYTLIGFTFWQFFSSVIGAASGSVYEQAGMLRKIYFPRAYIPLTIVWRQFFDFGVGTLFLLATMLYQGVYPTFLSVTTYLVGAAITLLLAAGLALTCSALSVVYRDVRHLIPFVIQIWFYLTPVFYHRQVLSGRLGFLALVNPITGVLDLVRAGLFGGNINVWRVGLMLICSIVVALAGLAFFRRLETEIIDKA